MTQEIFGNDPYTYGVKGNRKMLETLINFSQEQGLIKTKPQIEELFARSTLDLEGSIEWQTAVEREHEGMHHMFSN